MIDYYGYVYLILDTKHNKIYIGQKKGKIEETEASYDIVLYHLTKQVENNKIVKGKNRGNKPILYKRVKDEIC